MKFSKLILLMFALILQRLTVKDEKKLEMKIKAQMTIFIVPLILDKIISAFLYISSKLNVKNVSLYIFEYHT